MVSTHFSLKFFNIAIAIADPSSGSVLEPISSKRTREFGVEKFNILLMFLMCELNVDTEFSILC